MQSILFWAAVTLYALSTVAFFAWFAFRRDGAGAWGRALALAGTAPHAGAVALRWLEVGHGPWSTRYEVLSGEALLVVVAFLLAGSFARGLRGLGAFVMPAVFLMMGWAVNTFHLRNEVPIIFKSYWLALHIGFAKVFVACALMAAASAVAYLLRSRNPAALARLPASEDLDLYTHQFMLLAFLCLGVMIVAGSLWANQSWGRYWGWDPIETSALVTWIAFGVILHFRVLHRWTGPRMAWLALVGFAFAMVTMYVVVLVVPTIHDSFMVGR